MKLLVFMTTWLLVSCGDPTTYEAKSSGALVLRRVTKNKIVGKVVRGEIPDKRLQHKLAQRITRLKTEGISMQAAKKYLDKQETFFHAFFAMRDSAGSDVRLIKMLGIDARVYFDMLQQLQLPATRQLAKIISVVAKNDRLLPFYSRLTYHADIEGAIDAGKINYPLGDRITRNPELAELMQKRLNTMRARAERENTLRKLRQPELHVQIWMRHGQTTSKILQKMTKSVGGTAELASILNLSEARLRSCLRSIMRSSCKIERIISSVKDNASLKSFADELEKSIAIEKAIDAGAIFDRRAVGELRTHRVDDATLKKLQRELQAKRIVAEQESVDFLYDSGSIKARSFLLRDG